MNSYLPTIQNKNWNKEGNGMELNVMERRTEQEVNRYQHGDGNETKHGTERRLGLEWNI